MPENDILKAILNDMGNLGTLSDLEVSHETADDLLIETIRALSTSKNHDICLKIADVYDELEKRYG